MNTVTQMLVRLCIVFGLLLTGAAGWAQAPKYDSLYVFGDSLSDTGNDFLATQSQGIVPAIPPSKTPYSTYFQGHFSNGPVAVEYLWRLLSRSNAAVVSPIIGNPPLDKPGAVNFSFGGAATGLSNATPSGFVVPGLLGQVNLFATAFQGKTIRPNALYVVWIGSNDYIQGIAGSPDAVIANITTAIRSLYALGARNFLVPNLPDLGISPLILAQGLGPQFTQLSKLHNALLEQALRSLSSSLDRASFSRVDVFTLGRVLVSTGLVQASPPALAYLAPGTPAADCLFVNPATCIDVDLSTPLPPFLFWDVLHPTTQVHGVIGLAMLASLASKPR